MDQVQESGIGRRIHRYRTENRLSLLQLGRLAGVSEAYLSRLERGKIRSPTVDNATKIATALGVSLQELLADVADLRPASNSSIRAVVRNIRSSREVREDMKDIIIELLLRSKAKS